MRKILAPTCVHQRPHAQRGDIALYVALFVVIVVTSAVLVVSLLLTRQLSASSAVADSERAFYAADSGLEEGLYQLAKQSGAGPVILNGVVPYAETHATYTGAMTTVGDPKVPCGEIIGVHRTQTRRLTAGPADCPL